MIARSRLALIGGLLVAIPVLGVLVAGAAASDELPSQSQPATASSAPVWHPAPPPVADDGTAPRSQQATGTVGLMPSPATEPVVNQKTSLTPATAGGSGRGGRPCPTRDQRRTRHRHRHRPLATGNSEPGSEPAPDVSITDYGAKANDSVDDTAAIQAAINACGTRGGSVLFPAGSYLVGSPVKLPAGNTSLLKLSGYDATVKLTNATPRFLVWNRTTPHQTFRKFSVEGFTVDAGNRHPADGSWSVLGFDMTTGGSTVSEAGYLNIEEVTVKDCTVKNVAAQNTKYNDGYNAVVIHIGVGHWGNESVANHINDILVDNCRLEGGERGVNINGYGYSPSNCNITLDRVYVRNCWHDTMVDPVYFGSSTNYHIGQSGKVGTCELTNCYGNRSFDCGVEIDQPANGLVSGCTIENANTCQYYYANFNAPLVGAGSLTFEKCIAGATVPAVNGNERFGFMVGYEGVQLGDLTIKDDCRYDCDLAGWREAVLVPSDIPHLDSLTIDGFVVIAPHASTPATGFLALRGEILTRSVQNVIVNGTQIY